jgi:exopolysaccharide biosynthesis predicted pyruvyltransferase EpsI
MSVEAGARLEMFRELNPALTEVLEGLRSQDVHFLAPAGNGGDCLIAAATFQILADLGVSIQVVDDVTKLSGVTLVIAGGGNLTPFYGEVASALTAIRDKGNRIVMLPTSVLGREDVLAELSHDATIFCRERQSYEHVRKHAPQIRTELEHDMALFLDVDRLYTRIDAAELQPRFDEALEGARTSADTLRGIRLNCMRGGAEKTFVPKGRNIDAAALFRTGTRPGTCEPGAWMMLEFCKLPAEITTNRLHIGIGAALVGTPTVLRDNNYGKISAVYEQSLRSIYGELVRFVDDE